MTLLYRGIWQDDRPDLVDDVVDEFQHWLGHKHIDARIPDEGHVAGTCTDGDFELIARRAISGATGAVQVELNEERPDSGERWTTRLTAIEVTDGGQWVWVDLERVADDSSQRPLWAAPRLARSLIDSGVDVRVDQVRLTTTPQPLPAAPLAGLIENAHRTLPLVVFSGDGTGFTPAVRRAIPTAERLAGALQVFILRDDDVDEFRAIVPDGLGVWGGAARVYLPNTGPGGLRPERHRYLAREQLGEDPVGQRGARTFAVMLSGTVTARRPPAAYETVRRELRLGRDRSDAELLALAESEIDRLTRERDDLKDQVQLLEEDLFDTQVDLDEAEDLSTRLQDNLQRIAVAREHPEREQQTADLSVEPHSMSEALAYARGLLTSITIPPGIERDLDDLDAHPSAAAWGSRTWKGLRALHLYADADYDGNFKQWCMDSGDQWAWPASDKKLALRESELVERNQRLREQRHLPVDTTVDPSGRVLMWAHLKIAEGGGRLAPRVYFYDDTRGPTGKVHIGFIGPHHYMENTKTN